MFENRHDNSTQTKKEPGNLVPTIEGPAEQIGPNIQTLNPSFNERKTMPTRQEILRMQQTIGNQAVQRLLQTFRPHPAPPVIISGPNSVQRIQIKDGKKTNKKASSDDVLDFLMEKDKKLYESIKDNEFELACIEAMCNDTLYNDLILAKSGDFTKPFENFKRTKGNQVRSNLKKSIKKSIMGETKEEIIQDTPKKSLGNEKKSTRSKKSKGPLIDLFQHSWQEVLGAVESDSMEDYKRLTGAKEDTKMAEGLIGLDVLEVNELCFIFMCQEAEREKQEEEEANQKQTRKKTLTIRKPYEFQTCGSFITAFIQCRNLKSGEILSIIQGKQQKQKEETEKWEILLDEITRYSCTQLIQFLYKSLESIVFTQKEGSNAKQQRTSVQAKTQLLQHLLTNLLFKLNTLITYPQILEVLGFIGSLEFKLLEDSMVDEICIPATKIKKTTEIMADEMEGKEEHSGSKSENEEHKSNESEMEKGNSGGSREDTIKDMLYKELFEVYPIEKGKFLKILSQTTLGFHGTTSMTLSANIGEIKASFFELLVCAPLIKEMDDLAPNLKDFFVWDSTDLIIKILSHTARKAKVTTMLEAMQTLSPICPTLVNLCEQNRIKMKAFEGIKFHINEKFNEAISYKTKEQARQLQVLTHILLQDPEIICLDYEYKKDITTLPVDLVLSYKDLESEAFIIEIEGLPNSKRDHIVEYFEERYIEKYSSILSTFGKGAILLMATPVTLENEVILKLYELNIPIIDLSQGTNTGKALEIAKKKK